MGWNREGGRCWNIGKGTCGGMGRIGIEKKGSGRKWDEVEQRKVENGKKWRYWS